MCSNTTLRCGTRSTTRLSTRSMKTCSRSKTSTLLSVTSPCTCSTSPCSAIASSAGQTFSIEVTPASECVVAPAGYSLAPTTKPLAFALRISSGEVLSVRYSVICGSNLMPCGTAARMRARYAASASVVVIGGFRFGITSARPNCRAVKGTTAASCAPSRTCRCQSSGRRSVSVCGVVLTAGTATVRRARSHRRAGARRSARRSPSSRSARGRDRPCVRTERGRRAPTAPRLRRTC